VGVTYSGLNQSVFGLDRVNSSSCECPGKIPVDSNASFFTSFSSDSSSPEVAEFCPTLRLVYFIAQAQSSTCIPSRVCSLPCNNFVQKVVPNVEKPLLLFLKSCMYPRFFFLKKKIVIPQAAHQALGTFFHVGYLRFPPLCN
jgi:hypothetical protein